MAYELAKLLIDSYSAGQQARMRELAMAQQEQDAMQEAQRASAVRAFYGGDQSALDAFPEERQKIIAQQQDLQAKQQDVEAKQVAAMQNLLKYDAQRTLQRNQLYGAAANAIERNPNMAPMVQEQLIERGVDEQTAAAFTPENLPKIGEQLRLVDEAYADPDFVMKIGQDAAFSRLKITTLPELQNAIRDGSLQKAKTEVFQETLAARQAGATTINIGDNQPLQRNPQSKAQQGVIDMSVALDKVNSVLKVTDPKQFTYGARTQAWIAEKKEKLGATLSEEDKSELAARTEMTMAIMQLFNAYRQEVTGAAASDVEIERLRESFLNSNLSWTQFMSAVKVYKEEIARKLRIYKKVLREGLDLDPNQVDAYLSDLVSQGENGNSPADRAARLRELKKQGISTTAAIERLLSEGYLTESEASKMTGGE